MATIGEQIETIQKEIRETPYHKGTEHHIGKLRSRLSKLQSQEIDKAAIAKGSGGGGYAVKKQGDATVVLVGPPSVGKSTLLTKITNAKSKIAPYAFTTLTVIPGMLHHKKANIQILDVPGIIGGAEKGKGRGREVLSVARGANLVVIIADINNLDQIEKIKGSLYGNGIRLDMSPPKVTLEKRLRGNIVLHSNIKQDLDLDTIREVSREFGYKNAEISIKEKLTMDRLIDAFAKNRVYVPSIIIINKIDLATPTEVRNFLEKYNDPILLSADKEIGIESFKDSLWDALSFVRLYLVKKNENPHFDNSIIMSKGQTLGDAVKTLGTDFFENTKQGKIWGDGSKFPGQVVSLKTEIVEGMQVRFV